MQAATPQQTEAPKTAREQNIARHEALNLARSLSAPRFYVQFASDEYRVDTDAVPGRVFRRGQITPVTDYAVPHYLKTIPPGALIPGSEHADRDGVVCYGRILQNAGPDAERLEQAETVGEHGLFKIAALYDKWGVYAGVDFDALFYPDGLDKLPPTHDEVLKHLEARKADLEKRRGELGGHHQIVMEVADALIAACGYAKKCQTRLLEETHQQMKLPPTDQTRKGRYDTRDEEALVRTGKARFDSSTDATAKALTALSEDRTINVTVPPNNDVADLVKAMQAQMEAMQKQNADQNALILKLMSERQPEQPKTEAPKPQPQNQPQPRRN